MGCGYDFGCKTCKKAYYLGYGSYTTWLTFGTLAEFDAAPMGLVKERAKNQRIRECLEAHDGHATFYVGWDWCHTEGPRLYSDTGDYGASELWIEDWGGWEHEDLEARDEKNARHSV